MLWIYIRILFFNHWIRIQENVMATKIEGKNKLHVFWVREKIFDIKICKIKMQALTKVTLPEPPVDVFVKVDALDVIFVEKHWYEVAGGGL